MDKITKAEITGMLQAASDVMEANRDYLCELDAQMGDGDLGLTMTKAFLAAAQEAQESELDDLGKLLMRCGMKMNSAAPSTMGTLMSSGMMAVGKALGGKTDLSPADMQTFFASFADGIAKRGKCQVGERTVLDSIASASTAAALATGDICAITKAAGAGAKEGLEKTKDMKPVYGKAAIFADRAAGHIDQGALAGQLFVQAIADYFSVK